MPNLKISEDLFLESQELNRFKRFIVNDGFKQQFLLNTESFGLFKGYNLPNGVNVLPSDCFKVDNVGAAINTVNIKPGRAINKYANILTLDSTFSLPIPANNLWYWIKIKYIISNFETGTVSIDINGNLTGAGTLFTEILRGQPNFPSKIKFPNSILNTQEYEVVDVVSDSSAVLTGNFQPETGLQYVVVGTFTPGYVPILNDKNIFEYDSVDISLIQEITLNTPPAKIANEEFYLARVRTSGLNVEIQDKRLEFFQTKAGYELSNILRIDNPIIGIESVKWNLASTVRDTNEVNIAWGFRTQNWSIDTTQNLITINSGIGGILKENDLTFYIDGMFNGWRLYTKSGKYFKVIQSNKVATQLNITLDYLDYNEFQNLTDELHIVPDYEEIEIKATYDANDGVNTIIESKFVLPIHFSNNKFYVRIANVTQSYLYNITYRYKTFKDYTDWFVLPNDTIGYYNESSFKDNGVLKPLIDRVLVPYTGHILNGFIGITPHPNNLQIIVNGLVTGDLIGVDHKTITNANPVVDLIVGQDRQNQILHFNSLVLSNDIFINLNKVKFDTNPCINGNRFIIQIQGSINLNGRNLRIVTDYVDNATYTLVRDILIPDVQFVNSNQLIQTSGLTMIFNYDGADWQLSISNEFDKTPKGAVVAFFGNVIWFDSSGLGISQEFQTVGWALCNGQNGTVDLRGRVIAGYSDIDVDYNNLVAGGVSYNVISVGNLPEHTHIASSVVTESPHSHSYTTGFPGGGIVVSNGGGYVEDGTSSPQTVAGDAYGITINSATTGITVATTINNGGGVPSPIPLDNRMPYKTLLYIQKII